MFAKLNILWIYLIYYVSSLLMSALRAIVICQIYFRITVISSEIILLAPSLVMRRCALYIGAWVLVLIRIHVYFSAILLIPLLGIYHYTWSASVLCEKIKWDIALYIMSIYLNQSTEVLTLLCMGEDFQMKGRTIFTESKMYTVHFSWYKY